MKKADYFLVFVIALLFFSLLSLAQKVPGYMDAEYYYGQGIRMAEHHDLQEFFIWNFLNDPKEIPAPGFGFWLPFTSMLAAIGIFIFRSPDFLAARSMFILLAAFIPVIAALISQQFIKTRWAGWMAAGLAIVSGFYLPYITIIDTFIPYIFLGGLFLLIYTRIERIEIINLSILVWILLMGIITGLMALTRSDGQLWLLAGFLGVFLILRNKNINWQRIMIAFIPLVVGYGVVMIPWYLHNYSLYHSIFPPGNGLILWMKNYHDLFVYPSSVLSFSNWIDSGFSLNLLDRFIALGTNVKTLIAAGGMIFLGPIMVIGIWKQRNMRIVRLGVLILVGIFLIMTILFPYAGARGGFFHSLSSLQILLWSLVPAGLDSIIEWGVRKRNWKTKRAWGLFGAAILIASGALSSFLFIDKLNNGIENGIPWNATQTSFLIIDQKIQQITDNKDSPILINDPPGFTLATGRPAIMIPSRDLDSIVAVSRQFDARFLAVNNERADILNMINLNEEFSSAFQLIVEVDGTQIYEILR